MRGMRALRVKSLAPLLAVVCLGAAGCGGDDDSSSTSASSEELAASELIKSADEICRGGVERFAEIQSETPSSAEEAETQTGDLVEVATEELDELRALSPPEELSAPYDAYLESRATALEQLERGTRSRRRPRHRGLRRGEERGQCGAAAATEAGEGDRAQILQPAGPGVEEVGN